MASPALEIEDHILHQLAVTLTAADRTHSPTPTAVSRVIFEKFSTPPHQLHVTTHQPEAFLIYIYVRAHRDNVVHRGNTKVEGCKYFIKVWHEEDHVAILKCNHNVCVVIEDLPM
ncbi:hypothetical protein D1007_26592 [Hordeum vulgare]|nr:hypothetical protein D1007_26592 [Hordeum vulgare]